MDSANRNYGTEIDDLKEQVRVIRTTLAQLLDGSLEQNEPRAYFQREKLVESNSLGVIHFAGHYANDEVRYKWEPQQRSGDQLLDTDIDKASRTLAALGHKQRLEILLALLREPLTGPEIVERLQMGTTGQLYHHVKALISAGLVIQEDRGGRYAVHNERTLPVLLLLAALNELLDTSNYLELAEAREQVGEYLGNSVEYDPHYLLWAVIANAIDEHRAGYCTEIAIMLNQGGSVTIADNGRGIPVAMLAPTSSKTPVQAVLTEMRSVHPNTDFQVPGAGKGINMAVVNALSQWLAVEVRRDGKVYRQDYKNGIPQTELLVTGLTGETGTSITLIPDREIFRITFREDTIRTYVEQANSDNPGLSIRILNN